MTLLTVLFPSLCCAFSWGVRFRPKVEAVDWSLLTCARKGHITYAPDEPELRAKLHTSTPVGDAWRCLRCGNYLLGEPNGRGPASAAPLVARGKQLRDALILKVFAVERVLRAIIVGAAAYGIWRFSHNQKSVQQVFEKDLALFKPLASNFGWDLDHSKLVKLVEDAFKVKSSTLTWVAVALAIYAVIELIEAVGLWTLKRWGEYFAVLATSFGLPLEIYDLVHKITALRIATFLVNVVLVLYLLISKRLFGIRGGKKAHEARLRSESLLEVEQATSEADLHGRSRHASAAAGPSVTPGAGQYPPGQYRPNPYGDQDPHNS